MSVYKKALVLETITAELKEEYADAEPLLQATIKQVYGLIKWAVTFDRKVTFESKLRFIVNKLEGKRNPKVIEYRDELLVALHVLEDTL